MINKTEINCSIHEKGLKNIKAYYSIVENRVHLFISKRYDAPFNIAHLRCKIRSKKIYCQFRNCRTVAIGSDFDEYLVEEAYIREDEISYKNNKYSKCIFSLTSDISPFFDTPWDTSHSILETNTRTLNFKSRETRYTSIEINENTTLYVNIGYSQSYSKVKYEALSSVEFTLEFKKATQRENIFEIINAITDFFSLFCQKNLGIWSIAIETSQDKYVGYYGQKLDEGKREHFGNLLIESYQLKDCFDIPLTKWIKKYSKNNIPLELIQDAQKVKDEQLRFICLTRCLEIYHKENYIIPKSARPYLEDLHSFMTDSELSNITLKQFLAPKQITLAHRIYDLARSLFALIKKDRLMFGYITVLNRCQQITDTRNYYMHFSDSMGKKAWKTSELFVINFQLSVFIKILFLKQVGFSDLSIKSVIVSEKGRFIF